MQDNQQIETPIWSDCQNCKAPMQAGRCGNCGKAPKKPAGMLLSVWHHKLRASGDTFTAAGCSCRGCTPFNMRLRAQYISRREAGKVRYI